MAEHGESIAYAEAELIRIWRFQIIVDQEDFRAIRCSSDECSKILGIQVARIPIQAGRADGAGVAGSIEVQLITLERETILLIGKVVELIAVV